MAWYTLGIMRSIFAYPKIARAPETTRRRDRGGEEEAAEEGREEEAYTAKPVRG